MPAKIKNVERTFHSRLTLQEGASVQNSVPFALNKLYTAIYLRIKATVTVGAGGDGNYVAATNPILNLIRNIQFKVSGDGLAYNISGAAAYWLAAMKMHKVPRIDNASFNPNAAAAYAMSVSIPLFFIDPLMGRPEDTILDMSRYTTADLYVAMGAGLDCTKAGVGAGAAFTLSAMTCDIEVETLAGEPRNSARPYFFQQVESEGAPRNVASDTSVVLGRAAGRMLKRVMLYTSNGGNVSRPFSGVASSAILDKVNFGDSNKFFDKDRSDEAIQDENQLTYKVDAATGLYILDAVKDKSNFSAIPTIESPDLKLGYTVDAAAPAGTNIVSVVSETVNRLKA